MAKVKSRKKNWIDPVKNVPAKDETMATTGNFADFTALMRRIVNKNAKSEKPKPSASRVPASS
jgi:hypothetical protein